MDRRAKAVEGISVPTKIGLELGPLASPIVRRSEGAVLYADHASTEALREKYRNHGWDTSTIVNVDIVLGEQPLAQQLANRPVDYIVTSHVIEHVPDVVGWLQELSGVLVADGIISLIIPDKRFCFDARRPDSTTGELYEAYLERRQTPTARQIFDFWSLYCGVDAQAIWAGTVEASALPFSGTLQNAANQVATAKASTAYSDIHCWVFTPASFLNNLADLSELGLLPLKLKSAIDTAENEIEFFVMLQKTTAADTTTDVAKAFREQALRMTNGPGG